VLVRNHFGGCRLVSGWPGQAEIAAMQLRRMPMENGKRFEFEISNSG